MHVIIIHCLYPRQGKTALLACTNCFMAVDGDTVVCSSKTAGENEHISVSIHNIMEQ